MRSLFLNFIGLDLSIADHTTIDIHTNFAVQVAQGAAFLSASEPVPEFTAFGPGPMPLQ